MENKEENLVKKTCRELGITQKELAEKIGVHNVTVRNWTSKGNIPEMAKNFMILLLEKKELINYVSKMQDFINIFDDLKGVRNSDTLSI
jgi:transcriptional regulator with XRE-family HTH domain